MLKIFLGLTLLLLVACAGASIAPEEELSAPPTAGASTAKPGLVEPAAATSLGESAEAIPQQAEYSGDGGPVEPAVIPAIRKAEGEFESASPSSARRDQVASDASSGDSSSGDITSDTSSGVPQSEPIRAAAAEEPASEASSQPIADPLQAPAAGPEDSSPEDSSEDASPRISLPQAPSFTLTSVSGEPVSLEAYRGESNVVLVFYRGFW